MSTSNTNTNASNAAGSSTTASAAQPPQRRPSFTLTDEGLDLYTDWVAFHAYPKPLDCVSRWPYSRVLRMEELLVEMKVKFEAYTDKVELEYLLDLRAEVKEHLLKIQAVLEAERDDVMGV